jgi:beta-mannosidase
VELTGRWTAHPADDELRRTFHEHDFRDDGWVPVTVPGHWSDEPAFRRFDGPLLYRHRFTAPLPAEDERVWIRLDGVFYQGDVWLDSAYAGDTEGYFFPHQFEITEQMAERGDHVLAVEVSARRPDDAHAKSAITGAFGQGDHLAPGWNPGGIWRPVHMVTTGPVAIRHARLKCTEASDERATLTLRLVLDTTASRAVVLRTRVSGTEHEERRTLAAGENRVEWSVGVVEPDRWWPHSLGPSTLHDVHVDVVLDDDNVISDRRRWRTGFRTIDVRNWIWHVNGERLFVKGANIGPARPELGRATPHELAADVRDALAAGLDLLRVHTHVSRRELYEAADEVGILVWQDLPLHRRYARSVRKQALRQAREAVDLLAHHPSVALWCAHNEPYQVDEAIAPTAALQGYGRRAVRSVLPQQVPSWNRSILDGSLKRAIDRNDGTRPVIAHSGVAPHLPQLDGTDSHLWFGWYEHDVEELAEYAATLPRGVRFVSEFGAQAPPDSAEFCHPELWPDLPWEGLVGAYGCQTAVFDQRCSPDDFDTFDEWRAAAQAYQAYVVRRSIELLRRLKYRPVGGFCVYRLSDARPSISFSLIDHERRPKAAYGALRDACRPVLAIADAPPSTVAPGVVLELAVHVVSDLRRPLEEAAVRARATWSSGTREWTFAGDIAADACVRVGRVAFPVPPSPGPLRFDFEVHHADLDVVVTSYETTII